MNINDACPVRYWGEPERAPHWLKSVMVSYVACTDCENGKIWLTSHLSFVMDLFVACTDCENDKIRLTSHSSFVMDSYDVCTDCENDIIRLKSHSSFVMVSYITCTDCEDNKVRFTLKAIQVLSWSRMSHVQTVRMIKYDGQAIQPVSCVACADCEW